MGLEKQQHQWDGCSTEYDKLTQVIVCEPTYMKIEEVINTVQKRYAKDNIDVERALAQHKAFTNALNDNGMEVVSLNARPEFPEQVFTRDIGFTIGTRVFISEMASPIRQGEEKILREWVGSNGIPYQKMTAGSIEGGDVVVDGNKVFVGVSHRTNHEAIDFLEKQLPANEIIRVPFDASCLHLDCVFTILSPTHALVYPEALSKDTLRMLGEHYTLMEVEKDEQFAMGTNVLAIGNNKIISLPQNTSVNKILRENNFEVIEIDLSEIIKSGGSFRCCTMPLTRSI
ncbi:dimethylarginine dimethylaminohydrolase family protein [Chryseomicrobium sp. FSL W7-1435]|uniref:dimethylarginine dimethylaminohydrolase family protein n=1 Tax=Chryseomicrobium sp. FSL W7-1435 TaxID=2921704 RepID=UPI00315AD188